MGSSSESHEEGQDHATLKTLLPDDAILLGGISIISFIDSDGDEAWAFMVSGVNASTAIALLEKLKFRVLADDYDDGEDQ